MTKPSSSAARCDLIISLIDECLAEVEATHGLRLIPGESRTTTRNPARRFGRA